MKYYYIIYLSLVGLVGSSKTRDNYMQFNESLHFSSRDSAIKAYQHYRSSPLIMWPLRFSKGNIPCLVDTARTEIDSVLIVDQLKTPNQ